LVFCALSPGLTSFKQYIYAKTTAMPVIKKLLRAAAIVLLLGLCYGIYYASQALPIISGYGAKNMCSCITLGGRTPQSVRSEELSAFPLSLGKFEWHPEDSSVTGTVFGMAVRKAIYRAGLGCTLVNEMDELALRAQNLRVPALPATNTDTVRWPMGNRLADSATGVNTASMEKALDAAFAENDPKTPKRTRAMVVVYKGQIVAERYAKGYDRNSRLLGWSMTKSLTSALIGLLVADGKLNPDAPAPVPEWSAPDDPRHQITLKYLLQQRSGLKFDENYAGPSQATNMLFKRADMAAYTAGRPLAETPGSRFYYSSGNSNVLSRIVRQTVGDAQYLDFVYRRFFAALGMHSMVMEPDASGTIVGSSYSFATARDWARFGLLYLQNGQWMGQQLLPATWVSQSAAPFAEDSLQHYGYQFWLNAGPKGHPERRAYPAAPPDMFYADGYEHQYVFVIPSKKLVVVRLGQSAAEDIGLNQSLKAVLNSLPVGQ